MNEPHSSPMDRRVFLQAGMVATAATTGLVAGNAAAQEPKAGNTQARLAEAEAGQDGRRGDSAQPRDRRRTRRAQPPAPRRLPRGRPLLRHRRRVQEFRESHRRVADGHAGGPQIDLPGDQEPCAIPRLTCSRSSISGSPPSRPTTSTSSSSTASSTSETDWPKSKELKEAAEALKKTGKVKFVGFSTHDPKIAQQIQNAAEGGFIDVIMLKYTPWLDKDAPLNKALDACHAKNIGLVSMKQLAGQTQFTADHVPSIKAKGLTPAQGLLQAIWTDERFSASCVTLRNTEQIRENADAVRRFEPLKQAEIDELRDAVLASNPTMCPGCDGRCSLAGGTKARLGDLARFYTYYESHGMRGVARESYAELAEEERDWKDADLVAAREACHHKIDFSALLPEVDRLLS